MKRQARSGNGPLRLEMGSWGHDDNACWLCRNGQACRNEGKGGLARAWSGDGEEVWSDVVIEGLERRMLPRAQVDTIAQEGRAARMSARS